MQDWMIVAGVAVLIGGVIAAMMFAAKKRREAFQQAATDLGLEWVDKGRDRLGPVMSRLRLFKLGRRSRVRNLMTGPIEDVEVFVFDYSYTTGSGKNSNTCTQTVVALRLAIDRLPEFELRPENLFHKIGEKMGYQDIDLPDHPQFSSKYVLRGPDEEAILRCFTADAIAYLTESKALCVEAAAEWVVVYRARKSIKPDAISDLIEQGFTVCDRLAYT